MRNRIRKQSKDPDVNLITCGKHKKRPWAIVCIHLCEGSSREWKALPTDNPKISDWVCRSCFDDFERIVKERDFSLIRPVCIMCIQKLRVRYDPTYLELN